MAISSGFGMMLSLFNDAGLPRPPCLIHHPTRRQGDIRLPSQAARIAMCGRFPGPVRCVLLRRVTRTPDPLRALPLS